jgi:hypothetical protein
MRAHHPSRAAGPPSGSRERPADGRRAVDHDRLVFEGHSMKSRIRLFLTTAVGAAQAAVAQRPGTRRAATALTVQGGVVRRGDHPGRQGHRSAQARRRRPDDEAGSPVTIATGFNSLGGFDLAPDGTLCVVDNCLHGR